MTDVSEVFTASVIRTIATSQKTVIFALITVRTLKYHKGNVVDKVCEVVVSQYIDL
jgi:hypothetical protein